MDKKEIYNDGNGVKITNSTFRVDEKEYELEKINEIKLLKLPSRKTPGITLFSIGFILMFLGSLDAVRNVFAQSDADLIAIVLGVVLVIASIVVSSVAKSVYAVKISTKEGESKPLKSKNKEYVAKVVNSLKLAYYRFLRRREVKR